MAEIRPEFAVHLICRHGYAVKGCVLARRGTSAEKRCDAAEAALFRALVGRKPTDAEREKMRYG